MKYNKQQENINNKNPNNNRNKNSYKIASKNKKNDENNKNDLIWYKTTRFHQTVVKSHYC